jgi:isopenicillin-N N-acyltransferase-like protein
MPHDTPPPPCPLIDVSGPPRDRGRQYGEQARARIELGIAHYTAQLRRDALEAEQVRAITATFAEIVGRLDPIYNDEMEGIAEGAGVPFSDILLLNARTEVLKIARRRASNLPDFIEPDGCTGVIAEPAATAAGRLIHAQNWDWNAHCAETVVVLRIRREDGPDILTFTEAGGLARAGFNAAGLSITGNYLESDRDYRSAGVPLAILRRRVLEQTHLRVAIRTVYGEAKSASNNMMVAQADGFSVNFECVPNETFLIQPQDGLLVHANHFQSAVALSKVIDRGIPNMPDSLYRDRRVREALAPNLGRLTVDHVKAALFDGYQAPYAVCRPPRRATGDNLSATVAMIVMEPAAGTMEVALLPALNRDFTRYELSPQAAAPASPAFAAN